MVIAREQPAAILQVPVTSPEPASRSASSTRAVALEVPALPQPQVTPLSSSTTPDLQSLAPSSRTGAEVVPKTGESVGSPEAVNQAVDTPATLSIPAIDVESTVQPLGLNSDGSLEVPARGPLYDEAGWFTGSPRPGQYGPAVVLGHVNGRGGVPSVFFRLAELHAGDVVTVDRADGSAATFEVYLTERYPKDQFPTAAVYGDTAGPELRLITCAGTWDAAVGHYRDNTVVYARLLPAR